MTALAGAALQATVAVGCVPAAAALASASWPRRSPGAAILLWQALGLGWGLAAVGALASLGVAPRRAGVVGGVLDVAARAETGRLIGAGQPAIPAALRLLCLAAGIALLAMLCWVLVAAFAAVLSARRRHRSLLALLARCDPKVPGALVVDHPAVAAYCVPGLRSRIVVSAGTLDLLRPLELAAVLAHERAHVRERHDLVLLPFTALGRAFPRSRTSAQACSAVALLIEMLADDRVRRDRPARELAAALVRFGMAGSSHAPSGTLAAADPCDGEMTARVARLLEPAPRLPLTGLAVIWCAAFALVTVPVALLVLPF